VSKSTSNRIAAIHMVLRYSSAAIASRRGTLLCARRRSAPPSVSWPAGQTSPAPYMRVRAAKLLSICSHTFRVFRWPRDCRTRRHRIRRSRSGDCTFSTTSSNVFGIVERRGFWPHHSYQISATSHSTVSLSSYQHQPGRHALPPARHSTDDHKPRPLRCQWKHTPRIKRAGARNSLINLTETGASLLRSPASILRQQPLPDGGAHPTVGHRYSHAYLGRQTGGQ